MMSPCNAYKVLILFPCGPSGDFTGPMNYIRATIRGLNSAKGYSKKIQDLPIVLVWGTRDGALHQEMARMSGEYVENFTLHFIEGASHWVQQDEPEMVNKYLAEFLNKQ